MIFSDEISTVDGYNLVDVLPCLGFNPFGEFIKKKKFEVRYTDKFVRDVSTLKGDATRLKYVCYYILLAFQGIWVNHNFAQQYAHKREDKFMELTQVRPAQKLEFSVVVCEALEKKTIVRSMVVKELVPSTQ
jgi:hypothetical protein